MLTLKEKTMTIYDEKIQKATLYKKKGRDYPKDCIQLLTDYGIDIYGSACPYCKNHSYGLWCYCQLCPLCDRVKYENNLEGVLRSDHCCDGLWAKISVCTNWDELIMAFIAIRDYIQENG